MNTSIITNNTDLGNMTYPFLHGDWTIVSTPIAAADAITTSTPAPTLRWVKDSNVNDLHIAGTDSQTFLAQAGLELHLHKGPFVLSKRISRIMRPFRYAAFFQESDVTLYHNRHLNPATWDGCGMISRAFVRRLADACPHLSKAQRRELLSAGRFEITVLHAGGQEKGDVIVAEMNSDIMFATGSTKHEVQLTNGTIFIGLDPRHSRDDMRLDIQSLVNLHPFFDHQQLSEWTHLESAMFLTNIATGQMDGIFSRLGLLESATDLDKLTNWWLAEYLMSGGQLMWFPGTIQAMARQHLNRLHAGQANARWPVPGGRYYIMPAEIGGKSIPNGMIELDPDHATAWVSTDDWNNHIVRILGGCDGDDAVWTFPFTDAADGIKKLLIWRSPNQLGEYMLLQPTADSHEIAWPIVDGAITWPQADSRNLPPRIDTVSIQYGELPAFSQPAPAAYTPASMNTAIGEAAQNRGALGAYCNVLLALKAVTGTLPDYLPARLEDVIDSTVKAPRNMTPVWDWIHKSAKQLAKQHAIPSGLANRISASLDQAEKTRMRATRNHWHDHLTAAISAHVAQYKRDVDTLATRAAMPTELLKYADWSPFGQQLANQYYKALRRNRANVVDAAADLADQAQAIGIKPAMIGLAHHLYTRNQSDRMIWQDATAPLTLTALRQIGLISEPVWTSAGAVLWHEDPTPEQTVTITFNGVWFNWLRAKGHKYTAMRQVAAELREQTKRELQEKATCLAGRVLTLQKESGRLLAYTDKGLMFGYVDKAHQMAASQATTWHIESAAVMDGNVTAILTTMR